jgi:transcriptional regulator with XRE-family HTH domain
MPKTSKNDLGTRRKSAGLTQTELAERLGVKQPQISNWENGKGKPDRDQQAKLETLLGSTSQTVASESSSMEGMFSRWLRRERLNKGLTVPELAKRSGVSQLQIENLESGRSVNPQAKTRAKLEQGLGVKIDPTIADDDRELFEIRGLGDLQDFGPSESEKDDWPACAGVYVLYDVSDRPVYVGKAASIRLRLNDHKDKFWFKPPIVARAAFIKVDNADLRHQLEQVLIKFLKRNAVLNRQSVDDESR